MKTKLVPFLLLLLCAGCAQDPDLYATEQPKLLPARFFNGHLTSYGFFQNWRGQAVKRFRMEADAAWQGDHGMMDEHFTFNDGQTQERHWVFHQAADGTFTGTAPDVTGQAKGVVYGNTLHWIYTITLAVNGKPQRVQFDDWLYLIDDAHLFSLVEIRKFGLPVGRLTMLFDRRN